MHGCVCSLVSFFGHSNDCADRARPHANIERLVSHFISLKFIYESVCRHSKALDARWMLIFIIIISLYLFVLLSSFASHVSFPFFFYRYASWNCRTLNSHLSILFLVCFNCVIPNENYKFETQWYLLFILFRFSFSICFEQSLEISQMN